MVIVIANVKLQGRVAIVIPITIAMVRFKATGTVTGCCDCERQVLQLKTSMSGYS